MIKDGDNSDGGDDDDEDDDDDDFLSFTFPVFLKPSSSYTLASATISILKKGLSFVLRKQQQSYQNGIKKLTQRTIIDIETPSQGQTDPGREE